MRQTGRISRALRHFRFDIGDVRGVLPDAAMLQIEAAITAGETRHGAEIRFVVEAALDLTQVWARATPRERALTIFSNLRIWDTEANNGILLYVLMADKSVEIVADRAAARVVDQASWNRICERLAIDYRAADYLRGTISAINSIHDLVEPHFAPTRNNPDELPNRPVVL